ncbi:MAG: hypothetical protein GF388_01675 [Candidatus Aegiribacteria sp.]|nr:hypothetical protein [Candidatus Aegiribacteria sp.]MBD3294083.1 hypothetical protein [Candidatus Fermentibacteria bacterium]
MKLNLEFDNGFEKALVTGVCIVVLAAVFLAGYLLSPGAVYAEWDSSSSFGDSYYLQETADNIDDVVSELSEISGILYEIERAMP